MKHNILFFGLFFYCPLFFSGQQQFQDGYTFLKSGDYQNALSQFLSIEQKNAATCMLIAHCYQELGHDILAKGYREKAFIVATFWQKMHLLDQNGMPELSLSFYQKKMKHVLYALIVSIPLVIWQCLFVLFLLLLLFSRYHMIIRCCILLMFVLIGFSVKQKYDLQKPRAMILPVQASLFLVPEEYAPIILNIDRGNMVFLLDQKNNYVKISTNSGRIGWIFKDDIFQIVPL